MSGPFDLGGRVAVVTGAFGRLGPVFSAALLDAGARVAGIDLPGVPAPGSWRRLVEAHGRTRIVAVEADVRDRASLAAARARIEADFGAFPTILVNNAGIDAPPGMGATYALDEIPAEVFRGVFDVNVLGAFQAIQVFGGEMARRGGGGAIVNIGSLYASVSPDARLYDHLPNDPPFLKPPAYGASKAALVNLTRYFATHWAPRGVRVNALSPGGVLGAQDDEFRRKYCARVPLGRMARPEDLGGPLVFLASDAAAYVTGIELRVDGGFTAW